MILQYSTICSFVLLNTKYYIILHEFVQEY